ncbi:MAG: response regulator [Planctomycetales bacterium]|nr:response regulator [Planctomycetales bacterium]
MGSPLRVLLIEDSGSDALLIARALESRWPGTSCLRVTSTGALRHALATSSFDIVLSDHALPRMAVGEAAALVAAAGPQVPFVVVSGAASPLAIAEAWKAGARDFVEKGDLEQLVTVVAREVARAREGLKAGESLAGPAAALVADDSGRIVSCDEGAARAFGLDPGEALGRASEELLGLPVVVLAGAGPRQIEGLHRSGTTVALEATVDRMIVASRALYLVTLRRIA